jgi:maleylacetoacetate isomerase
MALRLYDHWNSSSAYRVRIALGLKGLAYERIVVDRLRGVEDAAYLAVSPQGFVPALQDEDGLVVLQSLAILDHLEERFPEPALLPKDPAGRARVRALAQIVVADIQPLNNQRVQDALARDFGLDEAGLRRWYARWIAEGFQAAEALLAGSPGTGRFCHGGGPTLADVCLVPQVYNARRWRCDLDPYPTLRRIEAACLALEAFDAARPERQSDADESISPFTPRA